MLYLPSEKELKQALERERFDFEQKQLPDSQSLSDLE
jgi:hypothetical protein